MSTRLNAQNLDEALPAALVGREHGWATRYRRYPVFSAPWMRGRLVLVALGLGLFIFTTLLNLLMLPAAERPWPGFVEMLVELALPCVIGPALALAVRRRGWRAEHEWGALVGVMLGVVLLMAVFTSLASAPLKQFIAERVGAVDAQGNRLPLVMMVGINIGASLKANTALAKSMTTASTSSELIPGELQTTLDPLARALITFWLAGGLGLRTWRRERAALAALGHERALAKAEGERREAELRLSVLAAQVEPHFLFNTLAGVRSAINTDPARASEMVEHLAEYLRASIPRLRSDGSAQATLAAQFDIVRAYLALMAARLPRLQFSVHAETGLLAASVPPLLLISLVENAVKHGAEPKPGPVHVHVRAERSGVAGLALIVEDDGVGFGVSQAGSGLGLTNIRQRLQQLYGGAATLSLKTRPQGGVAARIELPLQLAPGRAASPAPAAPDSPHSPHPPHSSASQAAR